MSTARMLQSNFNAGELSPLLDGRTDLARYFNGCSTLENFFGFQQGGVTRRGGFRRIAEVNDSTARHYLIPFEYNIDQTYQIIAGPRTFHFLKNNAPLYTATGAELITNGTFPTDLTGWTDADFAGGVSQWLVSVGPDGGGVEAMGLVGTTSGDIAARYQTITTVTGTVYRLQFDVISLNGAGDVFVGTSLGNLGDIASQALTLGANTLDFTAPDVITYIYFRSVDQATIRIDNVTCKALGGISIEVTTPYAEADIPFLQWRQSADVIYFVHPNYPVHKLSRLSDSIWTFQQVNFDPPPTFEEDEDISGGTATLTPGATTGTAQTFTASSAVFLAGDVDRIIVYGTSKALITAVDPGLAIVTVDILDDFPNTSAIPAGQWRLRGPMGATLNPNRKEPIGVEVQMTANLASFRTNIVGKYIRLYDAVIEVTDRTSATVIRGILKSLMSEAAGTGKDPAAALEGTWHIEVPSFSDVFGYPGALEFHEGRLALAGTANQPTTWWMSASDSYENFARGVLASDAVEYTMGTRQVNEIVWLLSNGPLGIGTPGSEHAARGSTLDEPIGGDSIPLVKGQSEEGSARIQPTVTSDGTIFVQNIRRQVFMWDYDASRERFKPLDVTKLAKHITEDSPIGQGAIAYQKGPDKRIFFHREDGQGLVLVLDMDDQIIAWSRMITDGEFEAFSVVSQSDHYQLTAIIKRTINGATVRTIEYQDADVLVDCAHVGTILSGASTITGLSALEAKSVDVVIGGRYMGRFTVAGGVVTLAGPVDADATYHVGLPYTSTLRTMRPAIAGSSTEGRFAKWTRPFVRLLNSKGGKIQGQDIVKKLGGADIDPEELFTGDAAVTDLGWDKDNGRLTITQELPLPMTILAAGGLCEFA